MKLLMASGLTLFLVLKLTVLSQEKINVRSFGYPVIANIEIRNSILANKIGYASKL